MKYYIRLDQTYWVKNVDVSRPDQNPWWEWSSKFSEASEVDVYELSAMAAHTSRFLITDYGPGGPLPLSNGRYVVEIFEVSDATKVAMRILE